MQDGSVNNLSGIFPVTRNAGILLFKYAFHCFSVGGLIYHIIGQIICKQPEAILTLQLNDTIRWRCQSCQRQRAFLLLASMMDSQHMDFFLLFKYAPVISSWHIKTFGSKYVPLSCLTYVSSQPRDQTQVSHIAGRFFISQATREAQEYWSG